MSDKVVENIIAREKRVIAERKAAEAKARETAKDEAKAETKTTS